MGVSCPLGKPKLAPHHTMLSTYQGKAKILYPTDHPQVLRVFFKDSATAFNGQKQATIEGKGRLNCLITTCIFQYLQSQGIATHFLEALDDQSILVRALRIIPLEVVVRNISAGSLCKRLGIPVGQELPQPLVEFYYKNDALGDPLVTDDHIYLLGLAVPDQLTKLRELALEINRLLRELFRGINLILVDFKLEFGLDTDGNILLADEISPDSCRLWDDRAGSLEERIMDKDRFRQDLGKIAENYQEIADRLLSMGCKTKQMGDTD